MAEVKIIKVINNDPCMDKDYGSITYSVSFEVTQEFQNAKELTKEEEKKLKEEILAALVYVFETDESVFYSIVDDCLNEISPYEYEDEKDDNFEHFM